MAEVCYHMTPRAGAAMKQKWNELLAKRMRDELTSAEVRAIFAAFQQQLFRDRAALEEADADRNVTIKCPDCSRTHVIPGSVERFRCPCSPHQDRTTLLDRVVS